MHPSSFSFLSLNSWHWTQIIRLTQQEPLLGGPSAWPRATFWEEPFPRIRAQTQVGHQTVGLMGTLLSPWPAWYRCRHQVSFPISAHWPLPHLPGSLAVSSCGPCCSVRAFRAPFKALFLLGTLKYKLFFSWTACHHPVLSREMSSLFRVSVWETPRSVSTEQRWSVSFKHCGHFSWYWCFGHFGILWAPSLDTSYSEEKSSSSLMMKAPEKGKRISL